MKLLDTNILIYSGEAPYANILLPYVTDPSNMVSAVSKVETLGFHRITLTQIRYFESLFKILRIATMDDDILNKAIELRQLNKMSLGDSFVAATALVHGLELVTRNTADFSRIGGLVVVNPIP